MGGEWSSKVALFRPDATFDREIIDGVEKYVLVCMNSEMLQRKYISKDGKKWFYSGKLNNENTTEEFLKSFDEHPITYEDVENEMVFLLEHIPSSTKLLFLTSTEVVFPALGKDKNYYQRVRLNEIVERLTEKYSNVELLDLRKYATSTSDFVDSIAAHYNREISYKLAWDVMCRLENKNSDVQQMQGTERHNIVENDFLVDADFHVKTRTYIVNGVLYCDLTGTPNTISEYEISYEIWRNRFIEAIGTVQDNHLRINVNKAGKWKIVFSYNDGLKEYVLQTGVIDYTYENYIQYVDVSADDYFSFAEQLTEFIKKGTSSRTRIQKMHILMTEVLTKGASPADYYIDNDIMEISIFTDRNIGEMLIPIIHSSKVRIRYIFTTDDVTEIKANMCNISYVVKDINEEIPLSEKDSVLIAYDQLDAGTIMKKFQKTGARIDWLPYVLNWVVTKTWLNGFIRQRNNLMIFVRTPYMTSQMFDIKQLTANERICLSNTFDSNDKVLSCLAANRNGLPSQYSSISNDELRETMRKPRLTRKYHMYGVFDDRSGKYVNIENGKRKVVGQPNYWVGTVYLFGASEVFGLGNCDEDTIASKLQSMIELPFRIENLSNCWSGTGYTDMFRRLENTSFNKNDILVVCDQIWRADQRGTRFEHWFNFDALPDTVKTIDLIPYLKDTNRDDWFLLKNAYTKKFNEFIAEKIRDAIYESISLFEIKH